MDNRRRKGIGIAMILIGLWSGYSAYDYFNLFIRYTIAKRVSTYTAIRNGLSEGSNSFIIEGRTVNNNAGTNDGLIAHVKKVYQSKTQFNEGHWEIVEQTVPGFLLTLGDGYVSIDDGYKLAGDLYKKKITKTAYVEGIKPGDHVVVMGRVVHKSMVSSGSTCEINAWVVSRGKIADLYAEVKKNVLVGVALTVGMIIIGVAIILHKGKHEHLM